MNDNIKMQVFTSNGDLFVEYYNGKTEVIPRGRFIHPKYTLPPPKADFIEQIKKNKKLAAESRPESRH